ncbi:MAG: ABC transporter ATP-binding protein [bacterium]
MDRIYLTEKVIVTPGVKKAGRRLIGLVWLYKREVLIGLFCTLIATALYSSTPLFVKYIIDSITQKRMDKVSLICALIVGVFLVRWVIAFGSNYFITLGGMKLVENLRNSSYKSMQSMSFGFFEKRQSGELMSRLTNDTAVVQMFVTSGISEAVRIPIGIATALGVVIFLSAKLTIIALLLLPAIAFIISVGGKKMKVVSQRLQERVADFNAVIYEVIGLFHIVKMFSMEKYELDRFKRENRDTIRATMKQVTVRAFYSPMVEFLGACCLAIIFWIGAHDIIKHVPDFITHKQLTLGDVAALFLGLQQIFTQVNHINTILLTMQHAYASAERTFEIIDMVPEIQDKPDAFEIPEITGRVELEDVQFQYNPEEPVIRGVSLKVEPGMAVALVGPSGSGKSTFVKLLPRFYDVIGGSIKIDGIDIRDAKISSYRRHIGIVPQETLLFRGTIKENIAYGRMGATDEEIVEAAKAAYAHDFIMETPNGYETMVGERGITLSGGQRQRIAIARAILMDPKILILDEATSNVDNASEVYIQQALEKLMKGRTTFVIAHRLSTIRNADLIVVLDQGRITERGRHEELYKNEGTYRRLYDLTQTRDIFGGATEAEA